MEYDLVIFDNYYTLHESLNAIPLIRWMKKLIQRGIAFIVLDHTNSEGDLQGSKVKKRAMDLGLRLEMLEQNEINIDFQCDRYGKEHAARKFSLIPCFATSHFSYEIRLLDKCLGNDAQIISGEDAEIVAILALKKFGMASNDVAQELGISDSKVSKKLKSIGVDANLKKIDNFKDFEKEFRRLQSLVDKHVNINDKEALNDFVEGVKNRAR